MQATHRIADHPDGHGFLACPRHTFAYLGNLGRADGAWFEVLNTPAESDPRAVCSSCGDERERKERTEYSALSEYERGVYDYVAHGGGHNGTDHAACMAAVHSL